MARKTCLKKYKPQMNTDKCKRFCNPEFIAGFLTNNDEMLNQARHHAKYPVLIRGKKWRKYA